MIKKGYHYLASCDAPKCDMNFVVGTTRHNFDSKRQAKQKLIKEGWVPGQCGTTECPKCKLKREKKNAEILAANMAEADRRVKDGLEKARGVETETPKEAA